MPAKHPNMLEFGSSLSLPGNPDAWIFPYTDHTHYLWEGAQTDPYSKTGEAMLEITHGISGKSDKTPYSLFHLARLYSGIKITSTVLQADASATKCVIQQHSVGRISQPRAHWLYGSKVNYFRLLWKGNEEGKRFGHNTVERWAGYSSNLLR